MKLSKKGDYGLRALVEIALNYGREPVHIRDIAKKENIPVKFLEQILLNLKRHGVLQSKMGGGGGYFLAREPENITLGEVIRILDGPIAPVNCVSKTAYIKCPEEETCKIRAIMEDIRSAIADILDRITLKDVCDRTVREKVIMYYI